MHGISVTEVAREDRTIITVATAVIGLVATAPGANAAKFPLDRPVLITSLVDAIAAAGDTGTLKSALIAIADQVRAPVIVGRVAPAADDEATDLSVIGTDVDGAKTGMQALLAAEVQTKYRPRIIGAPGLDTHDVATELGIVAAKLRAMAYISSHNGSVDKAITYRAHFTARELMITHLDVTAAADVLGNTGTSYAVARALGLRALIDQTTGWHKTLSNVPVAGVVGLTHGPFTLFGL